MKIAIVTSDGETVDDHFGKALGFVVMTTDAGKIVSSEFRDLAGYQAQQQKVRTLQLAQPAESHDCNSSKLIRLVPDCDMILSGGMCTGAYHRLQEEKLNPFLTNVRDINEAIEGFLAGQLENRLELVHPEDEE